MSQIVWLNWATTNYKQLIHFLTAAQWKYRGNCNYPERKRFFHFSVRFEGLKPLQLCTFHHDTWKRKQTYDAKNSIKQSHGHQALKSKINTHSRSPLGANIPNTCDGSVVSSLWCWWIWTLIITIFTALWVCYWGTRWERVTWRGRRQRAAAPGYLCGCWEALRYLGGFVGVPSAHPAPFWLCCVFAGAPEQTEKQNYGTAKYCQDERKLMLPFNSCSC